MRWIKGMRMAWERNRGLPLLATAKACYERHSKLVGIEHGR